MAKKAQNDLKAKQKRQKIIAAVGGVLLLVVLAVEVPSTLKRLHQKPPPLPGNVLPPNGLPPGQTTPLAAPTLSSGSSAGTSTATPAGVGAAAAEGNGPASALAVYEIAPQAQDGQLSDLGRFVAKDPFVQQGSSDGTDGGSSSGGSSGGGSSGGGSSTPGGSPTPVPTNPSGPQLPASSALISVNGADPETVVVGKDFPAADANPPFHLVSATTTSAKVSIAGGSYADGRKTLTLRVGHPVTLMNTADGTKYTLLLVKPK